MQLQKLQFATDTGLRIYVIDIKMKWQMNSTLLNPPNVLLPKYYMQHNCSVR